METPEAQHIMEEAVQPQTVPAPAAQTDVPVAEKKQDAVFGACANGTMKLMCEVEDEAFATCVLGDGVAVEPSDGNLYAPADATVSTLFDTGHAIGLTTDTGAELLLHVGINTVKLGGKYFEYHVQENDKVHKGDLLITFDLQAIQAAGYKTTTPMIVCNTEDYASVKPLHTGTVKAGEDLLAVKA